MDGNLNKPARRSLVFASNNAHKLDEMRQILGDRFEILSLSDIGCHDDIPETADTLEGNAMIKARYVKDRYGYDCFADDTGLFVDALDGAPGVYSARFAGSGCTPHDNVVKLLSLMDGKTDRSAHFSTVIALVEGDSVTTHTGRVDGSIALVEDGDGGFGYDPVFIPEGSTLSFARMTAGQKNAISHRGRAVAAFVKYLTNHSDI